MQKTEVIRINALRNSDIKLQSADPEYATRAGSNNVHFLLPLKDASIEIRGIYFSMPCRRHRT